MAQKNYYKWSNYEIKVDESLLNNIKNFVPVDGEKNTNSKAYRLTKNGRPTGIFNQKNGQNMQNNIQNQINLEINEEDS